MAMKFTRADLKDLKQLVLDAKDAYYNKGRNLRINLSEYSEAVATALKKGRLDRSATPVLPEQPEDIHGMLEMTDAKYDLLEKVIQSVDPKWQPISGARPEVGKVKTKLPVPMSSLSKIYPGDGKLEKYVKSFPGPWVVSDKLDGNAIEIVYKPGGIVKAYTKTSSTVGQDVSFLIPHMNIPQGLKVSKDMVFRCETVMPVAAFLSKYRQGGTKDSSYKTTRNLVAGAFNRKTPHPALADIHVLVHEIMGSPLKPSAQLAQAAKLGFSVVPHMVVGRLSESVLSSMLSSRKSKSKYDLDGLVINQDKARRINYTGADPDWCVSFKVNAQESAQVTTVLEVEWNASKHGQFKPRVKFKPIDVNGVTIQWASGHNAFYIVHGYTKQAWAKLGAGAKRMPIGPGAQVEIVRSGEVIPYITKVVRAARTPALPDTAFSWDSSGVNILLGNGSRQSNSEESIDVEVKRITAFLRDGLGVERMAVATVRKLYDNGWTEVKDFLTADVGDFTAVEGIQLTSAKTYYSQIQKGLRGANIAAVAAHSGFFGRLFATKRMQLITKKYSLAALAKKSDAQVAAAVRALPGFSDTTTDAFVAGLKPFAKWVATLPIKFAAPAKPKVVGSSMLGQAVCFTGFRDSNLESAILQQGGAIVSGVTSKTTALVVKDLGSSSAKADKARALGIPIYTSESLVRKFKALAQ